MSSATPVALVAAAAMLWIAKGLIEEVIKRLGERFAAWLLPEARPSTYRLACVAVRIARLAAPAAVATYDRRSGLLGWTESHKNGPIIWVHPLRWDDPEAVLAELEADKAGDRITQPVRLVLPVIAQGLRYRCQNALSYLRRARWWTLVGAPVLLILLPMFVWWYLEDATASLRENAKGLRRRNL